RPTPDRKSFTGFLSLSVSHLIPADPTISIHIPIHFSIHNPQVSCSQLFTHKTWNNYGTILEHPVPASGYPACVADSGSTRLSKSTPRGAPCPPSEDGLSDCYGRLSVK